MLRNFDTDLDRAGVARMHTRRPVVSAPVVSAPAARVVLTETVTVIPVRSVAKAFVAKADAAWEWRDLRDFVVTSIEARFGVFPRDERKEASIFKAFLSRQPKAVAIARYSFEVLDGHWGGAPISVNRFCLASDVYYADVIAARLVDSPVAGW